MKPLRLLSLVLLLSGVAGAQVVNPIVGSGGNGIAATAATGAVYATNYGVVADARWANDVKFTNGSGIVTWGGSDPPVQTSDVGKICFGTNYQGGTGTYQAYTVIVTQGTITSVNVGAHEETCSTNSSSTTTGTFVVGSNRRPRLLAAANAAFNTTGMCGTLILPAGGMLVDQGIGNSATCQKVGVVQGDRPGSVRGQGMRQSVIIPVPSFNFATCTGEANGCFFAVNGISLYDFSINGAGNCATGSGSNVAATYLGLDAYQYNIDVDQWGCSDNNVYGYSASGAVGSYAVNINSNAGGSVGLNVGGGAIETTSNSYFCCNVLSAVAVGASSYWTDYASGFQASGCGAPFINIGGYASLNRSGFTYSCNNTYGIHVQNGATVYYDPQGIGFGMTGTTGSVALAIEGGGTLYARNAPVAASGTSRAICELAVNAVAVDLGGNSWSGGAGNCLGGIVFGSASAARAAQVASNITASTGWGTSGAAGNGISSVNGQTMNEAFTVTAAGTPSANPTIAVKFPTAFLVAPSVCYAVQVGGTGALNTLTTSSGPTATAVTFTWNGTPVGSKTYIFNVVCSSN